ncbi:uncharacterized protein [Eurosta solidaginis]|uniref:uncharacterized protein n=1 Tax=Eurosta solidaginis TaxID=178769 RepID=UPI0035311E2D
MRRPFLAIVAIPLILSAQIILSAPVRKKMRIQLNSDYLRAMGAYKRLEPRLSREDLRILTTIGILNGARQVEKQMERNVIEIVKELLKDAIALSDEELIEKLKNIEKQLLRDHRALLILTSAMDLVTGAKNVNDFKADMQQTLQEIRRQSNDETLDKYAIESSTDEPNISNENSEAVERLAALRRQITQQVRAMKTLVEEKVTHTLNYMIAEAEEESLLAQASKKVIRKRNASAVAEIPAVVKSVTLKEDFHNNLVDAPVETRNSEVIDEKKIEDEKTNKTIITNSNNNSSSPQFNTTATSTSTTTRAARATTIGVTTTTTISPNTTTTVRPKFAKQVNGLVEPIPIPLTPLQIEDEDFPDEPPPTDGGGGGGLVGIITSLSGGEGGSDIGALIGALTGVISTLFGPGGLDIESLISTATSLISGLLAGNKNFGTVLGIYIGTAFDGLSGGGGAVNNGQFIGNLLGTVYAQLSADPEDDDLRPNPLLFARNLISSFVEAKNRKESDEEVDDERRSDSYRLQSGKNKGDAGGGGSDSGGFIKHIASHIVGGIVSLILNASLGASGGASHASASLFGSSSHKSGSGAGGGGNGGQKY